jgi:glycosyltransferase involved in cell wall biosynthesis
VNILIFNLRLDADDGVLGFTTDWVNALARRCDQVVVITMAMGSLRLEPNVTAFSVGLEKGRGRARRVIAFYALLWKVLRERRINVCFAHMNSVFAVLGAPLLKAFGVPTLLWYAHKSVTPTLRVAEKVVDAAVTSSASGFQLPSRKLTIIGQGIDTDRFTPASELPAVGEPLRLLSFGRISRVKRIEIVLEALSLLRANEPGLEFGCRIVGDPPNADGQAYLSELQARTRALCLEREVRFERGIPYHQAHDVFIQADVFLNPGDTDSVDKTGLEAMSCGVPMITSNIAFKDILPAEMQPPSIVPKNDPEALAVAITNMAKWSGEERRAFGLRGRAMVVAEHSIDSLADKLMRVMSSLVERRRAG